MEIIIIIIVILSIAGILRIVLNSDKYKQKIGELEKNNNITVLTGSDISLKDKDFYRDIPFDKNKYYVFFLTALIKGQKNAEMTPIYFMQGCFVDFIQKGILEIKKETETKLIIKNEIMSFDNDLDYEFFEILKSLSNDNIIDKKHISMIDENMSNKIIQWYIKASQYGNILWHQKKAEERHKDIEIIRGLEKFLLEYSNIEEKSSEEVKIWEEYLTVSVILGIANNVVEELGEVVPNEWFVKLVLKSREMIFNNLKNVLKM